MNIIYRLIILVTLLIIPMGCSEDTVERSDDLNTVRETGYLSCSSDNECDSGIRCQIDTEETECISEDLGCNEISCACLASLCGPLSCTDRTDTIACISDDDAGNDDAGNDNAGDDNAGDDNAGDDNAGDDNAGDDNAGDDVTDYNPCENKMCGDACTICELNDSDCIESNEVKSCNDQGDCVPDTPNLICGDPTCEDISERYTNTINEASTCNADTDCQILSGQCDQGLGSCYEAVNLSISQNDLERLASGFADQCGPVGVCGCSPISNTATAICNEGMCQFMLDTPEEYDPCENKVCGDICTHCDLNDPTCVETNEVKACNDAGACVPETSNLMCEVSTCEEIETVYDEATSGNATSCTVNTDCQILNGQCGQGLGGCYEAVNGTISQNDLDILGARYSEACVAPACSCEAPPSTAVCVNNMCEIIWDNNIEYDPCEGRICGESCTICDPNDPSCVETNEITACNAEGVCVPDTPNLICESTLTCEDIEEEYNAVVRQASDCQVDADCQVLNGQCSTGLGGCYEIVNMSIAQEELNQLGVAYGNQCDAGVCDCAAPPNRVECNAGICQVAME